MFQGPFTFPGIKVGSLRFFPSRSDLSTRDGTGALSGVTLGAHLWAATADIECLTDDESLEVEALVQSAQGSAVPFIVTDPRRWWPRAYRRTGLVGITAEAASFSLDTTRSILTMTGLTPNTMLQVGDLVGFRGGEDNERRHAASIMERSDVAADGTVIVKIDPPVWSVVDGWDSVKAHLDKPGVTMKLTAETTINETSPDGRATHRLVAMQTLAF